MSSSPDIIKDASDALKPISDRKIIVMQGWYDKNIHDKRNSRGCDEGISRGDKHRTLAEYRQET